MEPDRDTLGAPLSHGVAGEDGPERVVKEIVQQYGIWTVLDWLEDHAEDISTWGVDY